MKIFGYEISKIKRETAQPPQNDFSMRWMGGAWVPYEDAMQTYIKEGYLKNAHVAPIVGRIIDKALAVPFFVSKIKNASGVAKYESLTGTDATEASIHRARLLKSQVLEEIDDTDPAAKLLQQPNQVQSWAEFLADLVGYDCLAGEQIVAKQGVSLRTKGMPLELYSLPPHLLTFIADESYMRVKSYKWQPENKTIEPEKVVVVKRWNPVMYDSYHLRGMSPLRAMLSTLQASNEAQSTMAKLFMNQGPPMVVFPDSDGLIVEKKVNDIKEMFRSYIMKNRRGEIAVNTGKLGKIDLGVSPVDLRILESELASLQNICNAFGVDSLLFGKTEGRSGTASELEYARKRMVLDAVMPVLVRVRSCLNRVYEPAGYFVDFDISGLPEMQSDMKIMAEVLEKMPYATYAEKRSFTGWQSDDRPEYQDLLNDYLIPNNARPYLMGDAPAPDAANQGEYE